MIMRTHVFDDYYFIKRYSRVPNASVKHTINVHIGKTPFYLWQTKKDNLNIVEKSENQC